MEDGPHPTKIITIYYVDTPLMNDGPDCIRFLTDPAKAVVLAMALSRIGADGESDFKITTMDLTINFPTHPVRGFTIMPRLPLPTKTFTMYELADTLDEEETKYVTDPANVHRMVEILVAGATFGGLGGDG